MVKNISISHTASGNIIFQRVYSWKATSAFSNLGSLIQGFYQFAREVDDGNICGIDFESANQSIRKKRDDVLRSNRGDTMNMMTIRSDNVTASIFFDLRGQLIPSDHEKYRYQILLYAVKLAFEKQFEHVLQELKPTSPEVETMLSDNKFVAFNEIADKLCEVILGRSPEDPSNKSSIGTIGTPLPSMTDLNMTETDYHDKRILEENIRRYLARIDIEVERVDVNENFDGPSSSKYIN